MLQQQINEAAGCSEGSMGGVTAAIEQRARPQQGDWHYLVRNWFKARVEEGWLKPFNAPIYTSTGLVCAGRGRKKMGSVVILFDVSWSVPVASVEEMLGEVQWFLDELKPESVVLAETTTSVGNTWELFPGESVPAKLNYGGGTCLKPGFDWVAEFVPQCEGLIYMTDGDSNDLKRIVMPEYPVMWLDWSGGYTKYPFGEVVVMNRK
jgi:predicted metal-dependent peptidase